jgi:probable phosphoglycerate mutase
MSDLHCPAVLLVTCHGDDGRAPARELAQSLLTRKVARVYTSTLQSAVESGAVAAEGLGVDSVAVEGLPEALSHGDLRRFFSGAETDAEVERCRGALQAIADQHRGETVLVVTHGVVLPHCGVAEVSVDADGFEVLTGPGSPDGAVV